MNSGSKCKTAGIPMTSLGEGTRKQKPPIAITPAGSKGNLIGHMQMKDVLKIPLYQWGMHFGTSYHSSLNFIFPSLGLLYDVKCASTPYFLSLCVFISLHSVHPTPFRILTRINYRHRNAGWNVWPGACRILYQTPHRYGSNDKGGETIKTTLCFTLITTLTFPVAWYFR